MRFDATCPIQNAMWRNSGGFVPALVLILAALLVAARPARAGEQGKLCYVLQPIQNDPLPGISTPLSGDRAKVYS
jgi:hypothetical protein